MPAKRARVAALVLAVVAGLIPFATANADTTLIDYKCATVTWLGSIHPNDPPTMADDRSSGTLKHCLTVIKYKDANTSYDFYEARMTDTWTIANDGGYSQNHAYGHIVSSRPAAEWDASESVRSDHSCFDALSVSAGINIGVAEFGVELHPEICFDTWIRRTSQSSSVVFWDTTNVLKTHKWDEAYFVKVGQNSRPTFTGAMHYPWYTIKYDYSVFAWKNYEVQKLVTVEIPT